ncbi:MAG: dTMP kinase [Candidatus Nealsonbacteria bacterium]|nr:dTMP kinase [Candidatus Nealsonbacteria bacterium]
MIKNPHPGRFIVFDSLDGSGQSTQAAKLSDFLREPQQKRLFGHTGVHLTKEPTPGLVGGLIRGQLSHEWKSGPECLQLLFSADRAHHLEREIIPLLERGVAVICDRYAFSALAYGSLEIKDFNWLLSLQKNFLFPDLTIFLKVPPKICVERMTQSRYELTLFEKEDLLVEVWKNYEKLAKKFKHRNVQIIESRGTAEKTFEKVKKIVRKTLLN